MSRVILHADNQIDRLNKLETEIRKITENHPEKLNTRPEPGKWSVLEVIDHMTRSHRPYYVKLNTAIEQSKDTEESCFPYKSGAVKSWMYDAFLPKEGKIRYKMKTMKFFEPRDIAQPGESLNKELTMKEFYESLEHLRTVARASRYKSVLNHRFSSAIGPVIRFNVPEAVEFILRHNERHLQQIKNALHMLKP